MLRPFPFHCFAFFCHFIFFFFFFITCAFKRRQKIPVIKIIFYLKKIRKRHFKQRTMFSSPLHTIHRLIDHIPFSLLMASITTFFLVHFHLTLHFHPFFFLKKKKTLGGSMGPRKALRRDAGRPAFHRKRREHEKRHHRHKICEPERKRVHVHRLFNSRVSCIFLINLFFNVTPCCAAGKRWCRWRAETITDSL